MRPEHRVSLTDEQPPAWLQETGHDTGPPTDVGQPAQRADAREDEVERLRLEHVQCGVHVRLDEVDVRTGLLRQAAGLCKGSTGEVQPGHLRPQPGQGQRVGADVALQVDPAEPVDVTKARKVEADDVAEVPGVGDELVEGVVGGGRVRRGALVPALPVDGPVVGVAHAGNTPTRRQPVSALRLSPRRV